MEGILIKDAAKMLNVEAHVLRYWEEELGISIKRNQMGHRFYDEKDINLFREIGNLRDKGYSLKDIKSAIDSVRSEVEDGDGGGAEKVGVCNDTTKSTDSDTELKVVDFKYAQFQNMMNKLVAAALSENKSIISSTLRGEITEDVMKQMDILIKEKEAREEERFRKLDENIRRIQQVEAMVAATKVKKRSWWRK